MSDTTAVQGGPRCPNHHVFLVDVNWQDGIGICPVSTCEFTFDAEQDEKKTKLQINALGQYEEVTDWQVKGEEPV